jgi:hypothetical protein
VTQQAHESPLRQFLGHGVVAHDVPDRAHDARVLDPEEVIEAL